MPTTSLVPLLVGEEKSSMRESQWLLSARTAALRCPSYLIVLTSSLR